MKNMKNNNNNNNNNVCMYIFISSVNTKINMYKALYYINTKSINMSYSIHKTQYMAAMPARCLDHIMIFKGGEMK